MKLWAVSHFRCGPSISFGVQSRPITPSIRGITVKPRQLAARRGSSASSWSTALDPRMWESTGVWWRSWVTEKLWPSTTYSWKTGQTADRHTHWSGFVYWLWWSRASVPSAVCNLGCHNYDGNQNTVFSYLPQIVQDYKSNWIRSINNHIISRITACLDLNTSA